MSTHELSGHSQQELPMPGWLLKHPTQSRPLVSCLSFYLLTLAKGGFWLELQHAIVMVVIHSAPSISHNGGPAAIASWDMLVHNRDIGKGTCFSQFWDM